jgi:hypothetical protein
MAKFFSYFPKTFYIANNTTNGVDVVTNILTRFNFEEQLKNNSTAFYPYQIQDSDTPEIIADKYYGDSEKHWIVLLFNDIVDPQFDWPLKSETLIEYVDKKYTANGAANTTVQSGLNWALSTNNHQAYFKIVTTTANDSTTTIKKYQIDANTYANTIGTTNTYTTANSETVTIKISKETRSYYEYEVEENEKKREIRLLKSDFVNEVNREFKRLVSR